MNPIRVLIADDHTVVLEGLHHMLARAGDFDVVGEASEGQETLDRVEELHPDIVLLDARMPVLDGIEVTRRVKQSHPDSRVIILTAYDDQYLIDGVGAGADGYLVKDMRSGELAEAIRTVASGRPYIAPRLQRSLLESLASLARRDQPQNLPTPRQVEILRLAATGSSNAQIALSLATSRTTVKRELQTVFTKLGVGDRTSAVMKAKELKLI
jgi:DNA-binding NarL/FixJ family response regulator